MGRENHRPAIFTEWLTAEKPREAERNGKLGIYGVKKGDIIISF